MSAVTEYTGWWLGAAELDAELQAGEVSPAGERWLQRQLARSDGGNLDDTQRGEVARLAALYGQARPS